MAHQLSRLSKSILEQPQLIMTNRFEEIANVIETTDRTELHKMALEAEKSSDKKEKYDLAETEVGVLRIEGSLTNKPSMFGALCGLTSYQELLEQTEMLCGMENIKTIMMQVDSGGGEAYNLFSAATQIKTLVNQADKKLIAYIDGSSGSAAYGLTSIADEVIIHPDAMAGSIGVVVRLTNTNKKDEKEGIETKYITFGASKVPFEEDGSFREEFTADIQERVNELGSQFIAHVATNRGISEADVEATQAKMFSANKALELGLVDKIMTNEQFYEYLADLSSNEESTTSQKVQTIKLETQQSSIESDLMTDKVDMTSTDVSQLAQLQEQLAEQAKLSEAYAEQLSAYKAKEVEAAKASLSEGLSKFEFLAEDSTEALVAFLSDSGVSAEHKALLNSVLDSANLAQAKVKEEAVLLKAESEKSVEKVNAQKDSIKEEFGTKEIAETEVPAELSLTEKLAAKVAKSKAAKA
jgi:ClpP class serine protease